MEMSVGVLDPMSWLLKEKNNEEAATHATVATPPSHGLSENSLRVLLSHAEQ